MSHPKAEPETPWGVRVNEGSVLFITVDSCRYDTFASASTPNMSTVGPVHKAWAPSYFTFGSHAAMFVGFTPGDAEVEQQYLNPKYGKLFRLVDAGFAGKRNDGFLLCGENIIAGFSNRGYVTIGSGARGGRRSTGLSVPQYWGDSRALLLRRSAMESSG